jgi:hypothetical protein
VPDNVDYEWLGWLTSHPDEWSVEDLETAQALVASQKRAIEDEHPKDLRGRQAKQEVVDQLEAAIRTYLAR